MTSKVRDVLRGRAPHLTLFFAALLLRLVYLFEIRGNPAFLFPTADPLAYHERGLAILGGDFLGSGIFFHSSPLYPYFLALVYLVTGKSIVGVYLAQAVVSAALAPLLWVLARRLFDRTVAWTVGILACLYQPFIFFNGELLEITWVLTMVTAGLLILHPEGDRPARPSGKAVFLAGACLGLAALGKPNILATLPFVVAGLAWRNRLGRAAALRIGLLFLVGAGAMVAPATVRNLVVGHDRVLTTSNGGINFYIGNNPDARGLFNVPSWMESHLERGATVEAERAAGRRLRPSEVSRFWLDRGAAWIGAEPGAFVRLLARKTALFWNRLEIPNHFDLNFYERYSKVLRWTPSRFGLVAPLALLGIVLSWKRRRDLAVMHAFLCSYFLTLLAFFVTARYRLPVTPVLLLFAGYAGVGIVRFARAGVARGALPGRERRIALAAAAVLVLAAVLVHLPLYRPERFFAYQHASIASIYKQQKRWALAAEEYGNAIELSGGGGVLFHNNLGLCLRNLGDEQAAETAIRRALALDPDYPAALHNLGKLMLARADTTQALQLYRRGNEVDPAHLGICTDLSVLYAQRGEPERAAAVITSGLRYHENNPALLWNAALLFGLHLDRPAEALRLLDRLQAVDPANAQARRLREMLTTGPGG
jgi:tetratricopeptide (TPR) repeat protein